MTAPPEQAHQPGRRNGYEHLASLFVEYEKLADDDPRRARLRDALITGHRPIAKNIAHRYRYRGENVDDLEQVATVGLILAVDRFDVARGVDFLAFAIPTITGEVLRYFRDRSTTIRVPRALRELQSMMYDATAQLEQQHGRAARPSEIAAELGVHLEVVLTALHAQQTSYTSSLDEPAYDHNGVPGGQARFAAALTHTEPEFDLVEQRESLEPLLAALPERERHILMLRFFGGMTQTEIGHQLGISQMHVSRLLARTLTTLRHRLAGD